MNLLKNIDIKTPEGLWSFWDQQFKLSEESKSTVTSIWKQNINYLLNYHKTLHLHTHDRMSKKTTPLVPDNKILPLWRRGVGDLVRNTPTIKIIPNTTDETDISAAKVGSKVLTSLLMRTNIRKSHRKLAEFLGATGNGFLSDSWDKKAGSAWLNQETHQYEYAGDVDISFWSPFEIFPQPVGFGTQDFQDLGWVIKAKVTGLRELKTRYPDVDIAPESDRVSLLSYPGLTTQDGLFLEDSAVLLDCYHKPCTHFPEGVFCKCANGKILETQRYPLKTFPITHFKDISIPGAFWGSGTVEYAVKLQDLWNRTLRSILEYNDQCGKGKILAPMGADLAFKFDNSTGQIIYYNEKSRRKPEYITLKGQPPTFMNTLEILNVAFQDLFSQHEVTKGTVRSDIRSGVMLRFLQEQDFNGVWPMHESYEAAQEEIMARVLLRIQEGYESKRVIHFLGSGSDTDVFSFQGTDLRNNVNVIIVPGSSTPDSDIIREDKIYRKLETGLLNGQDPETQRALLKQIGDKTDEDIYSTLAVNEKYADLENDWIVSGVKNPELLVNAYDLHVLHINEHNKRRLRTDYQSEKLKNPQKFLDVENAFVAHILAHAEYLKTEDRKE